MNSVAFFYDDISIYLHGIVIAAAILSALIFAAALRRRQQRGICGLLILAPLAILLGGICARLFFWLFQQSRFDSILERFSLGSLSQGGYVLLGAFVGVLLSVAILRRSVPECGEAAMLDALAPAACLGVAVGRMSALFSADDLGQVVKGEAWHRFPLCVYDSDQGVWRLAVFAWEAFAAFAALVLLAVFFFAAYPSRAREPRLPLAQGDVFLLFLLYYGCTQCVLESLRTDSLYFNLLGLVRVSQVGALVMLLCPLIIFCVRLSRGGLRVWHAMLWLALLLLLATAFIMELTLSDSTLAEHYTIMSLCLLTVAAAGTAVCLRVASRTAARKG